MADRESHNSYSMQLSAILAIYICNLQTSSINSQQTLPICMTIEPQREKKTEVSRKTNNTIHIQLSANI